MTTRASGGVRAAQLHDEAADARVPARRSHGHRRGLARWRRRCARDRAPRRSARGRAHRRSRSARAWRSGPTESVDTAAEMVGFADEESVDTSLGNGRFCRPFAWPPAAAHRDPGGPQVAADRHAVDAGRRGDPPHRPAQAAEAKNLLLLLLIQDVAHPGEGPCVRRPRQRLGRRQLMAGFAVSINGGIWVSTEGLGHRSHSDAGRHRCDARRGSWPAVGIFHRFGHEHGTTDQTSLLEIVVRLLRFAEGVLQILITVAKPAT